MLCRASKAIQLTDDHKPEREDEAVGCWIWVWVRVRVCGCGCGRVGVGGWVGVCVCVCLRMCTLYTCKLKTWPAMHLFLHPLLALRVTIVFCRVLLFKLALEGPKGSSGSSYTSVAVWIFYASNPFKSQQRELRFGEHQQQLGSREA